MEGTGKKLCFRFSGYEPTEETHDDDEVVVEQANLRRQRGIPFNDLGFYRSLWNEAADGGVVVSVEISEVHVRHNSYCHGIQAGYTVTFADGRIEKRLGPGNFMSSGYYSYHGEIPTRVSSMYLDEDEFITGLDIRWGDVVDRLAVVTNRRAVGFGGTGGSSMTMTPRDRSSFRVVAFAGILDGVCARIGFYAEPLAWEAVGPAILLRELVKRDRATTTTTVAAASDSPTTKPGLPVRRLLSLDEGLFRCTVGFLVPSATSWNGGGRSPRDSQ